MIQINDEDEILTARDLSSSLQILKKYDQKTKFRSVVKSVIFVNNLFRLKNQNPNSSYLEFMNNLLMGSKNKYSIDEERPEDLDEYILV